MANLQGFPTRITIDEQEQHDLQLWNVVIANGEFSGGGMPVAPGADGR